MAIAVSIVGKYDGKDIARAQRELDALARQAGVTQSRTASLATSAKSFLGPALIGAGIGAAALGAKLGVDAVQGAMADEAASKRLAVALKNIGTPEQIQQAQDYIDKLGMMYGVTDDEARPALQRLATATGSLGAAQGLLNVALDVSAGSGKSLEAVSVALAKAAGGQTAALGKLVPGLDQATLKSGDLSKVTDELSKRFGGQAAAAADTWQGKIKRLTVAGNELSEAFGYGILDGFNQGIGKGSTGVDGLVGALHDAQPGIQALGKQLGMAAGELIHVVGWLGQATSWLETVGITSVLTGQRISLMTGSIGYAINAYSDLQTLMNGGKTTSSPGIDRGQEMAAAWNKAKLIALAKGKEAPSWVDFSKSFKPEDASTAAAAASEKAYQAYLKGMKDRSGAAKAGASKTVEDVISGSWMMALGAAGNRVNAFADSQESGFGKVGIAVLQRVIDGITIKGSEKTTQAVRDVLSKGLQGAQATFADAEQYGKGIHDAIMGGLDIGNVASDWQTRQDAVQSALKDLMDAQAALSSEATDAEKARITELQGVYQKAQEDAAKGGATIVDAFVQQAAKAGEFAGKLRQLLSAGLNETTWGQIAALSADQGIKVADAFIDGNMQQNIARANDAVGSVDTVAKQVADQAAKTFKIAGLEAAVAMLTGLSEGLLKGSARKQVDAAIASIQGSIDRLNSSASAGFSAAVVTTTATADTSGMSAGDISLAMFAQANGIPAFASGGVATKPTLGVFGEAGPEALVPLDRYGSMGGSQTNIYVTVEGSVSSERDLITSIRDGIAQDVRRRGGDPSFLGV